MLNDLSKTFTNRREATALFQFLRGRDPNQPWPLLPILALISPAGGGKSTLINHLVVTKCCLPDGRPILPYAYIDFTLASTPKKLFAILVTLRNQLKQLQDDLGKHLTFPRFDLGAAIALAAPMDGNLPVLTQDEAERNLIAGTGLLQSLGEWGNVIDVAAPFIPPLEAVAKFIPAFLTCMRLAMRIPQVQNLVQRLSSGPGWKWYQTHSTDVGLRANAGIDNVLSRLQILSMPDNPYREKLLEHVLPAAFLADLRDALDSHRAWTPTANAVLFLDGFETLFDTPTRTGIRLLEELALSEHRSHGETDPLLIVIGTQQRLPRPVVSANGSTPRDPALTPPVSIQDEQTAQVHAQELYHLWSDQLPPNRSILNLTDLYLELWLHDFEQADTRDYLARLDELRFVEQKQTAIFTRDPPLMQTLHTTTLGHPFYLALAASALIAARDRGKDISPEGLADAPVPSRMVPGYEDEAIGDFLLSLFLHQIPPDEHDGMVFCAAPRTLDIATLRAVLQLSTDIQAREHWNRYRKLAFMRALDEKHIVFHPLVRALLLRQLVPDRAPDSDYSRIHTRLHEHFHRRGEPGDRIEEVYHALALGDPEPSITVALEAQHGNIALWDPLREAVAQAPGALMPPDIKQRAIDATHQARQNRDLQSSVTAVVLNLWLSNTIARGMVV